MQKGLKWTSAQPIRRPDNIISSKARETGNIGFKPSYLSEPTENMRYIMSNEYMRMWFNERGRHEKDTYARLAIIKEESKIKRRFVQRMMTYRKPDKNEFLEEKNKKNATATNKETAVVDYRKFKYKPECEKGKERRTAIPTLNTKPESLSKTSRPKKKAPNAAAKQIKTVNKTSPPDSGANDPPIILCPMVQATCCSCPAK